MVSKRCIGSLPFEVGQQGGRSRRVKRHGPTLCIAFGAILCAFISPMSVRAEKQEGEKEMTVSAGTTVSIFIALTTAAEARTHPDVLRQEMFGPASLVVEYDDESELAALAELLEGQLTTTLQAEEDDDVAGLTARLTDISGRVLWNGWPTGVTVSYAQHHGGPYPATTSATTSVGTAAIRRFLRPVAFQTFPASRLPEPLQDGNPWGVPQRVDGVWRRPSPGTRSSANADAASEEGQL